MTDTLQRRLEARGRTALARVAGDTGAEWAFRVALVVSAVVFWVVGRRQWFIRDDWAFLLSRQALRATRGIDDWLLTAQDGHWMTPPLLVFRGLQNVFGMGSYWPYLTVNLALHVGAVLLVRVLCRRWGVSPWTSTLLCSILLVFGGGWMNIVFAVQITYNLSLVCFLAQVLLADHDGPIDRRDWLGAALGVLGVMSSGFGPFFIAGMAALLVLRGRWRAAAIAVLVPAMLLHLHVTLPTIPPATGIGHLAAHDSERRHRLLFWHRPYDFRDQFHAAIRGTPVRLRFTTSIVRPLAPPAVAR